MNQLTAIAPATASTDDKIERALTTVRTHLGMEIAYLSEFVDGRAIFRKVSAPGLEDLISPGDSHDLSDIYCNHILEGRLPNIIGDTADHDICLSLPITSAAPIGSHASVPIHRPDGTVYGMFCCLSPTPNPTLNDRDLAVMQSFADLSQDSIQQELLGSVERQKIAEIVEAAMAPGGLEIVFQPLFHLGGDTPSGFEALSRFSLDPPLGPDVVFAAAAQVGRQAELECFAASRALEILNTLPEPLYVSVNFSPETIVAGEAARTLKPFAPSRVVVEITEHIEVADYAGLLRELSVLRETGFRLAVDDAGAGYSGLRHIVQLNPDLIKLDMSLTTDIDSDPSRRSLTSAMVHFGRETGAIILAEGIETDAELATLRELGVPMGQGYLLGRPTPASDLPLGQD